MAMFFFPSLVWSNAEVYLTKGLAKKIHFFVAKRVHLYGLQHILYEAYRGAFAKGGKRWLFDRQPIFCSTFL